MPDEITSLLHRRSDLSTFLIHLTRDDGSAPARENLISILSSRTIEARRVYGMARQWANQDDTVAMTQKCVCFSEAPLEQVWMLTREIVGRAFPLSRYGLAVTKAFGRRRRANPVWYLDITPGHDFLTNPVNALVEIARRGNSYRIDSPPPDFGGPLAANPDPADDPILRLAPFIEQMGPTTAGTQKEFWWEREWRSVGDFNFESLTRVVAALAPSEEHAGLIAQLAAVEGQDEAWIEARLPFLDPEWGLERMIAALARVPDEEAGPIPQY